MNRSAVFFAVCLLSIQLSPSYGAHGNDPIEETIHRQKEERKKIIVDNDIELSKIWDNGSLEKLVDSIKKSGMPLTVEQAFLLESHLSLKSKTPSLSCSTEGEKSKQRNLREEIEALLIEKGRETDQIEMVAMAEFKSAQQKKENLEEVVYKFPGTTGAILAADRLAHYYADHGEWDMAALYARKRWDGRKKLAQLQNPIETNQNLKRFLYLAFGMAGDKKRASAVLSSMGEEKEKGNVKDLTAAITAAKPLGQFTEYLSLLVKAVEDRHERKFDRLLALLPINELKENISDTVEMCLIAKFFAEDGVRTGWGDGEFEVAGALWKWITGDPILNFNKNYFRYQQDPKALFSLISEEKDAGAFESLMEEALSSGKDTSGIFRPVLFKSNSATMKRNVNTLVGQLVKHRHPDLNSYELSHWIKNRRASGKKVPYNEVQWFIHNALEDKNSVYDALRLMALFPSEIEEDVKRVNQKIIQSEDGTFSNKFGTYPRMLSEMGDKGPRLALDLYNARKDIPFRYWFLENILNYAERDIKYIKLVSDPQWKSELAATLKDEKYQKLHREVKRIFEVQKEWEELKKNGNTQRKDEGLPIDLPEHNTPIPKDGGLKRLPVLDEGVPRGEILKKEEPRRRVF